jgi:hypothetical protein
MRRRLVGELGPDLNEIGASVVAEERDEEEDK